MLRFALTTAACCAFASAASAAIIPEIEANETKATATPATLGNGDAVTGNSTGGLTTTAGTTSADTFLISTGVQTPAIYRNRLTITTTGTAGHTGSIRGLGQTATNGGTGVGPGLPTATAPDIVFQSSSTGTTPARFNQFYTFGRAASVYYRVAGSATTTADYVSTLTQDVITPVNLGSFQPGSITLTNTGLTSTVDSDIIVYDSTFTAIQGYLNDDFLDGTTVPTGGSTLNSLLTRTYAPGTYYVAISNFNTADSQLSPADEGTASANYLDFPGVMANSSTTVLASIPFAITDSAGTTSFTATKANAYDIYFASFTVVPEPASFGLLGLGGLGLLRRRR